MRGRFALLIALGLALSVPAVMSAQAVGDSDGKKVRKDIRHDRRELHGDRTDIRHDTRDIRQDRRDIRQDRRDVREDVKEGDLKDARQDRHEPVPVRSTDIVTQEELGRVATASTLYEALHALRPGWFRRNPTTLRPQTEGDVVVYVDQSRLGGPEALRTLQVNAAVAIRHYSASEAEARFGPGHLHGAIQVVTSR